MSKKVSIQRLSDAMVHAMDRRTILKSAGALAMVGASALLNASAKAQQQNTNVFMKSSIKSRTESGEGGGTGTWRQKQVGIQLAHEQFTVPELLEFGSLAEQAGFDVLAASDHLQPWQANEGHAGQAWITLAAIGQRTKRIRMGTTVTCPTFRYNPAVVAEAFASMSLLYPGRIFLGIGSGEALNEEAAIGSWPKWPERSERLIEAAEIIRKLWTGQPLDHIGKYYKINARLYDPPAKPIPLLMAANGPKAMHRAGQYADGLITDPKTWKQYKPEFEKGARDAGKDPGRMPVFIEQYVVVGAKKDVETAAELWRFGPKAWNPYYNVRDPQTIQQRADAEVPLEKVYADWAVGTDPEIHIKALTELFNSGATEIHIHSGQSDQQRVIDFYGKEVLPQMRKMSDAA